jgi:tetratricopeptide (TPR) repeat protein
VNTIGANLVTLMHEAIERELVLGPDAEELTRLGIHRRRVQLASLKARDRGELVESCDRRTHEKILAEDVPARPWPELERQAREVHARLVERVAGLSDDELLDEEPWRAIDEPALWRQLLFSCVRLAAVSEYLRDRGEVDEAIRVNERASQQLRASALPPKASADPIYNLACLHAGSGRTEEAVRSLAEAVRLNPHLVDWSRKDRDLDPIRGEEAYAELVA